MDKALRFVELLLQRTQEDKIRWNETDVEDAYTANLSKNVVRIRPLYSQADIMYKSLGGGLNQLMGGGQLVEPDYILEVSDGVGNLIEQLGLPTKPPFEGAAALFAVKPYRTPEQQAVSDRIAELHKAVKVQMQDAEAVLESLIEELQ